MSRQCLATVYDAGPALTRRQIMSRVCQVHHNRAQRWPKQFIHTPQQNKQQSTTSLLQVITESAIFIITRHLGYERVYVPLCVVADTPSHIQGGTQHKI